MLEILGTPRTMCGGVTRRDFLQVGGLGTLGLSLSEFLRMQSLLASSDHTSGPFGKAKSCILCFPYGSPPQHETFDPKPEAPDEIRGDYSEAIDTTVSGLQIGQGLPELSRVMDRVTVIRSMSHPFPVHGVAYATTGIPNYTPRLEVDPRDPDHWPFVGSCVDYVMDRVQSSGAPRIPRNIALPWKMNSKNGGIATAGPYGAFLGPAYDPVVTEFKGTHTRMIKKTHPAGGKVHDVADPYAGVHPDCWIDIEGAQLRPEMTVNRLNRRRSLSEQLDSLRSGIEENPSTSGYDRFNEMAYRLLTGVRMRQALDVRKVSEKQRRRYGMTLFGQSCLAARRLVASGGKFVTVFWDEIGPINTDWDTHWNQTYRLKDRLLPGFDNGFSALIEDLDDRGMLDETLVIWMSEHGRTPSFNANAGRDHWSRAYSIVLAGGGVARGRVVGSTDRIAGDVTENPISPKDILATIYYLLGIDPELRVGDRFGVPRRIAGEGQVRRELFA